MKKITVSKNGLQSMGLKVNMGKTKVIISGRDLHTLQTSGKYPCAVCRKDVGKNSILCSGCSCWVHKKCSDIPGGLAKDPDFRGRCPGNAWAIDRRPCVEVQLADEKLDVVNNFVYFGDCICPSRGSELATIKGCRSAQGEFEEILPLLTCEAISLNTRGQMCNSCIRGSMLYLSECWALPSDKKVRNVWSVVKEQCCYGCATSRKNVSAKILASRLKLKSLDSVLGCTEDC